MSDDYSDDNDFVDQGEDGGAPDGNELHIIQQDHEQPDVDDATVSPTQIYSDALAQNQFSANDPAMHNNGGNSNQQ